MRYWPKVNSTKEVMFLNEIEDIFEIMDPGEFDKVKAPLFHQISKCVSSPHFQVAERVLYFWNNEYFCSLLADHIRDLLPIIFGPLFETANKHWNKYAYPLPFDMFLFDLFYSNRDFLGLSMA